MSDHFYRAFEDKHRGSRELIKERLKAYLPFILPLLQAYPQGQAIDLGCGRGEWLELLTEVGLRPIGIDLDDGMLAACRELGLAAEQGDAIAHLIGLPDESQVLVSAFHVVEHIAFEQLQTLVQQALRVLKPGGLLIMETPNPENILVATCNFYVDPSHERPIPPMLLSFLAEYVGFSRVKTVRLQEPRELSDQTHLKLEDIFSGVSPDYSIVAQKNADLSKLQLTIDAFEKQYGLSLEMLMGRWNQQATHIERNIQIARNIGEEAKEEAKKAHQLISQLQQHAQGLESRLLATYSSKSWKLTAPLRWMSLQVVKLKNEGLTNRLKALIKKTLKFANNKLLDHPNARYHLINISKKIGIYILLKNLRFKILMRGENQYDQGNLSNLNENQTMRARQIQMKLKQAMAKKQGKI
jgi:O-antigen chain-terminating methyltransferase